MKMCKDHWDQLREAIKQRGMWPLVGKSGQEAMSNLAKQLKGETFKYDPLMDANNMIWQKAVGCMGLYVMGKNDDGSNDGHYCPLCETKRRAKQEDNIENLDQEWIKGCADAILKYVQEKRLLDLS